MHASRANPVTAYGLAHRPLLSRGEFAILNLQPQLIVSLFFPILRQHATTPPRPTASLSRSVRVQSQLHGQSYGPVA